MALAPPARALRERLPKHEGRDRAHQACVLRERQEVERRYEAQARVRPAEECLHGDDRAGAEVDLGLVVELELLVLERRAQVVREAQPVDLRIDLGVVHGVGRSGVLGAIHRLVGAPHECVGIVAVCARQRDPDARADADCDHLQHEGLADRN